MYIKAEGVNLICFRYKGFFSFYIYCFLKENEYQLHNTYLMETHMTFNVKTGSLKTSLLSISIIKQGEQV